MTDVPIHPVEEPFRRHRLDLAYVRTAILYALWSLYFFATSLAILLRTGRISEQAAWLLADLTALVLLLRYQSQFINIALANIVFICWPIAALASTAWSAYPSATFYYAFQLLMTTLVALLICILFRLEQIVELVFWGMLLAALATIAAVVTQPWIGIDLVGNWRGYFPTKNVLGDAMVLMVISAACLFLQKRWRLVTGAAILLGLFLIFKTRSATPILSIMITLAPLPFVYALMKSWSSFLALTGLALIAAAGFGTALFFAMAYVGLSPIDVVLSWVGKDRSLTGRTMLWDLAEAAINERPWLGWGYGAYWINPPSEMLQVFYRTGQRLTHFHNNFVDANVHLGIIGPILLSLGIIVATTRALRIVFTSDQPIDIWRLLVIIQVAIQTPVQGPLMENHSMWQVVFLIAAIARR